MHIKELKIKNHPILKDIDFSFIDPQTNKPYSVVVFVGENGCGKTTLLNEIFNYSDSKYIVEKEINGTDLQHTGRFFSTFIRQGQLYYSSMDHIKQLINGEGPSFPNLSPELQKNLGSPNCFHSSKRGNLSIFGDKTLEELFKNENPDFIPGGHVAKLIDGKAADFDYDHFSSGQQELIFKLQIMQNLQPYSDFLLMDEPETSLHPRWQKMIVDYLISLIDVDEPYKPQVFIATHSEKVLESLIRRDDALIIRMYRDKDGNIKNELISQMELVMPKPTFAELDYVIFNIDSFEYCSELHDLLEWKYGVKGDFGVDKRIQKSPFYDESIHYKEWFNDRYNEISSYNIATYCRNYFHHPKDRVEPTSKELHEAILLLRNIISNL